MKSKLIIEYKGKPCLVLWHQKCELYEFNKDTTDLYEILFENTKINLHKKTDNRLVRVYSYDDKINGFISYHICFRSSTG